MYQILYIKVRRHLMIKMTGYFQDKSTDIFLTLLLVISYIYIVRLIALLLKGYSFINLKIVCSIYFAAVGNRIIDRRFITTSVITVTAFITSFSRTHRTTTMDFILTILMEIVIPAVLFRKIHRIFRRPRIPPVVIKIN